MKSALRTLEKHLSIYCVENDFYIEKIGINKLISLMENEAPGFSREDIAYSVLQLIQRKYVVAAGSDITPGAATHLLFGCFLYITPEGHEFLNQM